MVIGVRVAETTMQRTQLEDLIQSLARSRDENVLADVEAAIRVALQQSAITGSAEPLVLTLKQADERLARYNQPRLERVRRAVTERIVLEEALIRSLDARRLAERSAVIALLIEDGLRRAAQHPELSDLLSRLAFVPGDAVGQLQAMASEGPRPDVVVLDPMFPHRDKSALVKKEMQVFQSVVGEDVDADGLLLPALHAARKRVVVKRPRLAPPLGGMKPDFVVEGKSGRFDVYLSANHALA